MRIYVEFSPTASKDEKTVQAHLYEKWQYKVLWHLRGLEQEIEDDTPGGVILISAIRSKLEINVRGFSGDLGRKIYKKLLPLKIDNEDEPLLCSSIQVDF